MVPSALILINPPRDFRTCFISAAYLFPFSVVVVIAVVVVVVVVVVVIVVNVVGVVVVA